MAIVNDMNKIKDWLQTEVCDKITFKLPSDEIADDGYTYELVHPTAWALFTPSKDRLPDDIRAPHPSVCIRITDGEHRPQDGTNTMKLILNFCIWNPGTHQKDVLLPVTSETGATEGYEVSPDAQFQRNAEGWQDLYNFMDFTLRAIENAEYIADMRVRAEDGIQYGMTSDKEGLDDFHPYYLGWITFTVQAGNARHKSYLDLL